MIDANLPFEAQESEWISGEGPTHDIVVSSRIRLARNIAGFPFVNRATEQERREIVSLIAQKSPKWAGGMVFIDLNTVSSLDRHLLLERHLISAGHMRGTRPRGVAVGADQSLSVMVNEEDHLRLQMLRPGEQLRQVFEGINKVDDEVEAEIDYSFSNRFGYLTACPTNVGTGIRVSVMLHLPALRLCGEIDKVRRAARDMQLALRGFHGEGSEATGDFYQLSNQTTLGKTEEEILDTFVEVVIPSVVEYEKSARNSLMNKRRGYLEDQVWRAWGLLTSARLISTTEALQLLSLVRLGLNLDLLSHVDEAAVNALLLQCQPAHLQFIVGRQMGQGERAVARATLIRERLGA